jgi:hypothetical protein
MRIADPNLRLHLYCARAANSVCRDAGTFAGVWLTWIMLWTRVANSHNSSQQRLRLAGVCLCYSCCIRVRHVIERMCFCFTAGGAVTWLGTNASPGCACHSRTWHRCCGEFAMQVWCQSWVVTDCATACKKHSSRQVGQLHADRIDCESLPVSAERSTLSLHHACAP